MSSSDIGTRDEVLGELAGALEARVDEILAANDPDVLPSEHSLRGIISAAARLHARYGETHQHNDPLREDVSPTEAVDLACALLRARDLNPFDLALWFSRPS